MFKLNNSTQINTNSLKDSQFKAKNLLSNCSAVSQLRTNYKPSSLPGSFISKISERKPSLECLDMLNLKAAIKSTHRRILTLPQQLLARAKNSNCSQFLTDFEKQEIQGYKSLYFVRSQPSNTPQKFSDPDGYYIATANDHLAYRYEILEILGKGTFGQVLRCTDHKEQSEVAIKIIRKFKQYHESGKNEINILTVLSKNPSKWVVNILENFEFRGHLCLVFELLSIDLYTMLHRNNFTGFSLSLVRRFTQQILQGLVHLHSNGVIHCDLKPDNILLKQEKKSVIKIIDFGSSCEEGKDLLSYIQSRYYRAPEVVIEAPYDKNIDIWSLGCIVVEFIKGKPLFEANDEKELFMKYVDVIGEPPEDYWKEGRRSKYYFDKKGKPKKTPLKKSKSLQTLLAGIDESILDFVRNCLSWKPSQRLSAEDLLLHSWIRVGVRSGRSSVELDELK